MARIPVRPPGGAGDRHGAMTRHQPALVGGAQGGEERDRPEPLHGAHGFVEHRGADADNVREEEVADGRVGDERADQRQQGADEVGEAADGRERAAREEARRGDLLDHQERRVEDAADREGDLVAGQGGDGIDGTRQRRGEDGVGRCEKEAGCRQWRVEAGEAARRDERLALSHPVQARAGTVEAVATVDSIICFTGPPALDAGPSEPPWKS